MEEIIGAVLRTAALALELVGAAIIVGTAAEVVVQLAGSFLRHRTLHRRASRKLLGRGLVLGLEFLIAADVLNTIVAPTLQDLAILGAIVVLRTILSFSIEFELRMSERTEQESRGREGAEDSR